MDIEKIPPKTTRPHNNWRRETGRTCHPHWRRCRLNQDTADKDPKTGIWGGRPCPAEGQRQQKPGKQLRNEADWAASEKWGGTTRKNESGNNQFAGCFFTICGGREKGVTENAMMAERRPRDSRTRSKTKGNEKREVGMGLAYESRENSVRLGTRKKKVAESRGGGRKGERQTTDGDGHLFLISKNTHGKTPLRLGNTPKGHTKMFAEIGNN